MIGKLSTNLLEFLVAVITILLRLDMNKFSQKIFAYTDSSSALVRMYNAFFSASIPVHDHVGKWLVTSLMKYNSAFYSQYIRGVENSIAGSLSLDHYLLNISLAYA